MLDCAKIKPITGTFMNMLISDTGIQNNGLEEWERDFRFLQAIGVDSLFVIRTEYEECGVRISAEDPRSTTWEEDDNLLDMAFRLADKYHLDLYLGGPVGITNLHLGDWKKEVDDTRRYYERTVARYAGHPCFKGLYVSLEALPWHFHFLDVCREVLIDLRRNYPEKKTFMSPSFCGPIGSMSQRYTADQWVRIYGSYFFEKVAGLLDYCAPQDTITAPACRLGRIEDSGLAEWYEKVGRLFRDCGIAFWSNAESFQRAFPGHGEPPGVFRQADYRSLYMKLAEASPWVDKVVSYEYFSCMSPHTEWGSARRLLARYLEMIGRSPQLIEEYYPTR